MSDSADHLQRLAAQMQSIVGTDNVLLDEVLSEHTTFHIGGPADIFVTPETPEDVQELVALCRAAAVDFFILGRGSDLLVDDEGFRGVVIALSEGLVNVSANGETMTCQAGVTLREASEMACELGLSGLEFACGIPGSVGGACFMNAGAYGGAISDVLSSIRALMPDGSIATIPREELHLGYRKSRVKDEHLVVLSATFSLHEGSPEQIRNKMDDLTCAREEKQPLEFASAGSTFKRPEGHFVGKLVTDAGLKGYRVGDACVSEKHAGFVINVGHASSKDVHAVIEHVQAEVKRQFGVELEPEILFVGGSIPAAHTPAQTPAQTSASTQA